MIPHTQLDPAALERLRRLGGDAFTLKMTSLFLSYGAQKIGEARRALDAANLADLANAVHPIKSSAGNIGAVQVQHFAAQLEQLALDSQAETLPSLMANLEQAFASVKLELENKSNG
jgi:HPt (histidine-containing phosphotransfer) domain-containing protein